MYRFDDEILKGRPDYCLHNRTGSFAFDNYANNHVYDHSHPDVPALRASLCLNVTQSGVADGCFADYASIGGDDPAAPGQPASHGVAGVMAAWAVEKEVAAAWVNGHQKALDLLSAGLAKLGGGGGVLIANGGKNKHTNGFMMETFRPSTGDIRTIQAAASEGLTNQVHCNMYGPYPPDTRDCLAAFLVGTGPNAFFSGPDSWNVRQSAEDPAGIEDIRSRWRADYDKPLGPPTGLGVLGAGNEWRRDFAHASVTFNATVCQGTIRWHTDGSVTAGPGCEPGCEVCNKTE